MDMEDKLQEALETAEQLKDDLVPLALEYYLGVIDVDNDDDDEDDDSDDDGDGDGGEKKKKKKKGGKESKAPGGPADQKECK